MPGYNLMIVESPPKAAKIQKILKEEGLNFVVYATEGYIVELPEKEFGLVFDKNEVEIKWVFQAGKKKLMTEISKIAKNADEIYISTDDDREGERIASDVIERLKLTVYKRSVFNSISKKKILEGINNPRELHKKSVDSAITRRVIDRDVGWPVSEILRYSLEKDGIIIPQNLGTGRTIAPTLHILNDNQKAIDNFEVEEYQRIKIWYQRNGVSFQGIHNVRFMTESDDNMKQLDLIKEQMKCNKHTVYSYTPKIREDAPPEPLNTATLQQSSSNLYGFRGKETMAMAQTLYVLGLISYHRTDSSNQAEDTYEEILKYLYDNYDEDDILPSKRKYKIKKKDKEIKKAQNGHEPIRPSEITEERHPDNIRNYCEREGVFNTQKNQKNKINEDHLLIYELIWYRTIAVQMQNAIYNASEALIEIEGNRIKLTSNTFQVVDLYDGGTKLMKGWLSLKELLLKKSVKVDNEEYMQEEVSIPEFNDGEVLDVVDITCIKGNTRPPYNYGEGRLINKIYNAGLVRPSTLASVIPSLEKKKCIVYAGSIIKITRLGRIVDDWLVENAFWLNDVESGQEFEKILDELEEDNATCESSNLIMEYHERINILKEKIGFVSYKDKSPLEWQIKKAKELAEQKNIIIGEDAFKTRESIETFIKKHGGKIIFDTLGTCPSCKKGKIKENTKAYGCSEYKTGCEFTLWKSNMKKFFELFKVQVTDSYLNNIIIAALKKKPLLYRGLENKKGDSFDALIDIKHNKEYKNWGLNLSFPKKGEKIEEEIVLKIEKTKLLKNYENFKTEKEFDMLIERYFTIEGSETLCYSKIIVEGLSEYEKHKIESIGRLIKEYISDKNSILFMDNMNTIRILSFQSDSAVFYGLIRESINLIRQYNARNSDVISSGIAYKRNYTVISEFKQAASESCKNAKIRNIEIIESERKSDAEYR